MKVLLTGANGFVGSHVADLLAARNIPAAALLRPGSSRALLAGALPQLELRTGTLEDPAALDQALADITHVIHCAGATKARDEAGFLAVNATGTRHLVDAVNRRGPAIARLILVSSLAAAGPGTATHPRTEAAPPAPVSAYGRSKLAGEEVVRTGCQTGWTILRPPAVYGPRDAEFLRLFRAARNHLRPRFGGGHQQLSLVHVGDLAAVIVATLTLPAADRATFFVGSPEVVTARVLTEQVAAAVGTWSVPLPLPQATLWAACQWAELVSRITGRPDVLSARKYPELIAPGWVCAVGELTRRLGLACPTPLSAGLASTRDWYQRAGWLRP